MERETKKERYRRERWDVGVGEIISRDSLVF